MAILRKVVMLMLMLPLAASLYGQENCETEVRTYDVTCHGGSDGRAEIWKNGQLIELRPGTVTGGCTPAEEPVRLCDNIPSGAIGSTQTSGELKIRDQVVYLTSSGFNGSIMFEGGGTLIICGNAAVTSLNINETIKPVHIQINGSMSVSMNHLNLNANVRVTNYGELEVQGAGFNGEFFNHGHFHSLSHFNINSAAGSMYNTGTIRVEQGFMVSESSVFTNSGAVTVGGDLNVNSSGSLRNNCDLTIGGKFHINALSENTGRIVVSGETVSNSGTYKGGAGSLLQTRDLMFNSVMEGTGAVCASVNVLRNITINGSGYFTGRIDLCRGSGSYTQSNHQVFVNGATADCSCSPGPLAGEQNGSGVAGTVTWSVGTPILNGSTNTGLRAGTYTVTVALEGCSTETHTFTIEQPPVFTASVSRTGSQAKVSASGGNGGPYRFIWSDGYSSLDSVRNLTALPDGTYCVSVQDSKNCQISAGCVIWGTVVVEPCYIRVDYLEDEILVEGESCPCAWRVLTEEEPETGIAQAIFPVPCKDSVVTLVNCVGERTEHTLYGNKENCTPAVCPDPSRAECMTCPGALNPRCCSEPPCCVAGLDPDCRPGTGDLSATAVEEPGACGAGGSVRLTVQGGSGQYRTGNPRNDQDGLYITGLPVGETVITIYDVTKPEDKLYKTVTIPEPPLFSVSAINAADPEVDDNNWFTIQLSPASSGPFTINLGDIAPGEITGFTGSGQTLTAGPFDLVPIPDSGPFPITITDKYCQKQELAVWKRRCEDPSLSSFVPVATMQDPSRNGEQDGAIELTNLPSGYIALWSGGTLSGRYEGIHPQNLGKGIYTLVLKNTVTGCVSKSYTLELGDGPVLYLEAGLLSSCTLAAQLVYKDSEGNTVSLTPVQPVSYRWANPLNNETLSFDSDYLVSSRPLWGLPSWIRVEATDGTGRKLFAAVAVPAECYPECYPDDPSCCPNPDNPACRICDEEPCIKGLQVSYSARPARCGQPSVVELTVTGGVNNNYYTINEYNAEQGLYIQGLPVGWHTIRVYDRTSGISVGKQVYVPAAPRPLFSVVHAINPSLGENNAFTLRVAGADTGPYAITFEGFAPYYRQVLADNGSLGTYSLPEGRGNGPFYVTVRDSYCNETTLNVYRYREVCSDMESYVPQWQVTHPAGIYTYDGKIELLNLPVGMVAEWSGGRLGSARQGALLTNIPDGTYFLVVRDPSADCIAYESGPIVLRLPSIVVHIEADGCELTAVAKRFDGNGQLVSSSGLQYQWVNPATGQTIAHQQTINLSVMQLAGNPDKLTVYAFDHAGNRNGATALIPDECGVSTSCPASLSYILTNPTCGEPQSGAIRVVSITGNYITWVSPASVVAKPYDWSQTGLSAGPYNVQVHTAACQKTFTINLTTPVPLQVYYEEITGTGVEIFVTSGTAPYNYKWSDQEEAIATALRTGLEAGMRYTVVVTDARGCTEELSLVYNPCAISSPQPYALYIEDENRVTIIANGGEADYEYYWLRQNGQLNNRFGSTKYGLVPDTYTVTVTDALGCTGSVVYQHPGCGAFLGSLSVAQKPASTCNTCDGEAWITLDGITNYDDYVVLWNQTDVVDLLNRSTGLRAEQMGSTLRIYNVCSGSHEVLVWRRGENACAISRSFELGYSGACNRNCTASDLTAERIGSASLAKTCASDTIDIELSVSGGKMPYTYRWQYTPQGSPTTFRYPAQLAGFSNAQPGDYQFLVIDADGCDATETFTVTGPAKALAATETILQPACTGGPGQITIGVTGGAGNARIEWEDDEHAGLIRDNLSAAGIYKYTIEDEAGCEVTGVAEIVPVLWRPEFENDTLRICPSTGLSLEARYLPRYEVQWSSPTPGVVIASPASDRISIQMPGIYVLTRTYKNSLALCPVQKDTVVVVYVDSCRTTWQPCATYEYELPEIEQPDLCETSLAFAADASALRRHEDYVEGLRRDFTNSYVSSVMNSLTESLQVGYTDLEQHYTLYYYDQAGNLVRTVPPAGVRALSPEQTGTIETYWSSVSGGSSSAAIPSVHTEHTLATTYTYNSLNQLISQSMPDHQVQDLWEYNKTLTLPDTLTVSTLDADGQYVWAFANGETETQLYRSENGGKDFVPGLTLDPGRILDMVSTGGDNYIAVGTQGLVLRALNGAGIWQLMPFPVRTDLRKAYFIDNDKGYVLNTSGQLWSTTDGGQSWSSVATDVSWLSSSTGQTLAQALVGKTLGDIYVSGSRLYIGANDGGQGYLYESPELGNIYASLSFKRLSVTGPSKELFVYNGSEMEIISGQHVFRQVSGTEMQWVRRHDIEGNLAAWESNGQAHLARTSNTLYVSTDGSAFSEVSGIAGSNAHIVKSNGRIAVWSGTRIWRLENAGTLTELMPGNTTDILGYYYTGSEEYVAHGGHNVKNITTGANYELGTSSGIYYFNSFVVSGDLLLVCNGSTLYPLQLTTTGTPAVPHTIPGTSPAGTYREVRRIGSSFYVIGSDNRSIYLLSNLNGSVPSVSVGGSAIHQTAQSIYERKLAFRTSPDSYMHQGSQQTDPAVSVSGGVSASVRVRTGMIRSLSTGSDNRLYAFSDQGILFYKSGSDQELTFNQTAHAQEVVASARGSNGSIRIGASNGRVYRLEHPNDHYSLVEEDAGFVSGSAIVRMSGDYLLTSAGRVHRYNGTNWVLESGLHIPGFEVLNSTATAVLSGGDKGRILYKPGSHWLEASPLRVGRIYDVSAAPGGQHLLACGEQGTLLESEDAGVSFRPLQGPNSGTLTSVSHYGDYYVIGDEDGNLYVRGSGGYTTATVSGGSVSSGQPVRQLYTRDGRLWALRGREALYSSNGSSYTIALTASQDLHAMSLYEDYGFIVGDEGTAYRIVPEGVIEAGASGMSLSAVSMSGVLEAILLPTDEDISDDKGTGIPESDLRTVHFQDKLTGYVTGVEGIVLKSTDGGYHWRREGVYTNDAEENPMIVLPDGEHGVYADIQSLGVLRDRAQRVSSRFWYDELGRLVLSQNSKQYAIAAYLSTEDQYKDVALPTRGTGPVRAYSYTLYDKIGRITEVGELLSRESPEAYRHESQVQYSAVANGLVPNGTRVQITRTYYDRAAFSASESGLAQDNLRPRVASVTYQDRAAGAYERATHYSYDIHGNVESLVQHIREGARDLRKRIDYDYDLVSGKVNRVYYQKGEADQFIHRYRYDGDNRLTEVHTSRDGIIWTKEANYEYYAHGPLARTVLGDQSIETQDFAYTLQGWIKALNGQYFSYALGYFAGDYSSIGTTANLATPVAEDKDLYNGNIATMASLNPKLSETVWTQQFGYDQLNRITGSASVGLAHADAYKTSYSYDANGNILSLHRYNEQGQAFDALAYHYHNQQNGYKHNTNKLRWVDDNPALSANHEEDLEDQDMDNYHYDELGNLSRDVQEEIARIEWNVYGKVSKVIRTAESTKSNLEFLYDASGNRVAKIVKPKEGNTTITYYIRDVQGNVLSIYTKAETQNYIELSELYMFGKGRIGGLRLRGQVENKSRILGLRSYELCDHLGNVRSIISDKKTSLRLIEFLAGYDYLPFGMVARAEEEFDGVTRYGFNGKEKDDEGMGGGGATYDYGFRIYNPQLGKFLSVDPLFRTYPYFTPYQFASNTPIAAVDRDGLEAEIVINSPWFYEKIISLDLGTKEGLEEAQRLAWASVIASRPPGDYAAKAYRGAPSAGTFNWNEKNSNLLTVYDIDGNVLLTVIMKQDPPKIIEKDKGLWKRFKDLFNGDWSGKERITQPGGFNFYAEGSKGETRTDATSGEVSHTDLEALYTYLSYTRFGPGGPAKFEIAAFITNIVGIVQEGDALIEKNRDSEPSQKTYPNPDEYIEPDHDGNSGGNYITPDSSLYENRTYDKNKKQVSKDTINTSKKRMHK